MIGHEKIMSMKTATYSGVSTPALEPLGENSFTPPPIRAHFDMTQQNMERLRIELEILQLKMELRDRMSKEQERETYRLLCWIILYLFVTMFVMTFSVCEGIQLLKTLRITLVTFLFYTQGVKRWNLMLIIAVSFYTVQLYADFLVMMRIY